MFEVDMKKWNKIYVITNTYNFWLYVSDGCIIKNLRVFALICIGNISEDNYFTGVVV